MRCVEISNLLQKIQDARGVAGQRGDVHSDAAVGDAQEVEAMVLDTVSKRLLNKRTELIPLQSNLRNRTAFRAFTKKLMDFDYVLIRYYVLIRITWRSVECQLYSGLTHDRPSIPRGLRFASAPTPPTASA